jgi:glutaredoxin 3
MANITIYTRAFCGFCARAVSLLKQKGVDFEEIDAGMSPEKRQEMIQRANGASTYPQIFINDEHIGGCDDMMALDHQGTLDAKLQA